MRAKIEEILESVRIERFEKRYNVQHYTKLPFIFDEHNNVETNPEKIKNAIFGILELDYRWVENEYVIRDFTDNDGPGLTLKLFDGVLWSAMEKMPREPMTQEAKNSFDMLYWLTRFMKVAFKPSNYTQDEAYAYRMNDIANDVSHILACDETEDKGVTFDSDAAYITGGKWDGGSEYTRRATPEQWAEWKAKFG